MPASLSLLLFAGAIAHRTVASPAVPSATVLAPPPPGLPSTLHLASAKPHRRNWLKGVASWYGELWEGRVTASGEIFHQAELTACHPTLPFGTLVRVVNLRNRRTVIVRINDRGALRPDRVIDLSSAAAGQLGMLHAGTAQVVLEVIGRANGSAV